MIIMDKLNLLLTIKNLNLLHAASCAFYQKPITIFNKLVTLKLKRLFFNETNFAALTRK